MLKQRVITAVALVLVILAALAAESRAPFVWLSLALFAAAAWEWMRLNGAASGVAIGAAGLLVAVGGALHTQVWPEHAPAALWWAMTALWVLGGGLMLRAGPAAWPSWPQPLRWLLGLAIVLLAWLALVHARAVGINFLLSMMCLVWMADVAAYFGGRRFGRRKLAPSISPGKSWEGVWSGWLGVLLLAAVWIALDRRFGFDGPSLYTRLIETLGWALAALALVALAGLSVVGDLVESLVKRAAGAKDSSRLLPGHGGVLDRVDALLPMMPVSMALLSLQAGPR
jgi:phosphatidate cytidylyltransferase